MPGVETSALERIPLLAGLSAAELEQVGALMTEKRFPARSVVFREGDPGESLLVVASGLAHVTTLDADSGRPRVLARLRRGDVVGEISLLTGEPRSASVVAAVPTTALELGRDEFAAVVGRFPRVLENLSRILGERMAGASRRAAEEQRRGQVLVLLSGRSFAGSVPALLAAAEAASPGPLARLETARSSVEAILAELDDLLGSKRAAVVVAPLDEPSLPLLLDHADRTLAVATRGEAARLTEIHEPGAARPPVDLALLGAAGTDAPYVAGARVVRALDAEPSGPDLRRLARHLTRTRLGLALGAGGAKGYAHVGAVRALVEAGYEVDAVSGSSIGAIVGAWLAQGRGPDELERTMREAFTQETVDELFALSLSGRSTGLAELVELCRETTGGCSFAELELPLVVMTADLESGRPAPISEGPVWEALVAATALAGIFPPYESDGRRLVDGLALVPVPTDALAEAADVTVAVNLLSRETLDAWPGAAPPEPPAEGRRPRMLDTLLEVMDMAQLDASVRHAARADVVVTPRFGPSSWRDFHLADAFLAAGEEAARAQLPALAELARPAA